MLVIVAGRAHKGGKTYHLLPEDVAVDTETADPEDVDVDDIIPRCYFRHRDESNWQVKDLDTLPDRLEPCRPCRDVHDTDRQSARYGTAAALRNDYDAGDLPNGSDDPQEMAARSPSTGSAPAGAQGGRSD